MIATVTQETPPQLATECWKFSQPAQFLSSTVVCLSCRWQRLREPQHFLQLQRDLHQLLRHQTLTCRRRCPHSIPQTKRTISGAELQRREADPDRRNWTIRAFHHTDIHLTACRIHSKKTKAIVASANITSVLAEYSLHSPFLLFTVFTVSPIVFTLKSFQPSV